MNGIDFLDILNVKNLEIEFLERYCDKEELFLYGAGNSAFQAIEYLKKKSIIPKGIIDSDRKKWGILKFGLPVVSFEEAFNLFPELQVFISSPSYIKEIKSILKQRIKESKIFSIEYERLSYCSTQIYNDYLNRHRDEIYEIYNNLADYKSKITLECVLKSWLSADSSYLNEIYVSEQYFTSEIMCLSEEEVFVDCGAYNGDTFKEFDRVVGGKYKRYYGFEPQKECYDQLLNLFPNNDEKNHIFNLGVYDRRTQLKFKVEDDSGSSSVTDEGTQAINVTTIDKTIDDTVTFIKMDIEGSELPALKGAEKTIRKYKPKLAICIYHKKEDIVEIPKYLINLELGYRFYIRHHQMCSGTETVLYAI